MKKLLSILLAFSVAGILLFSGVKIFENALGESSAEFPASCPCYDTDAQAFIDAIGDCPTYFQDAINDRVLAFKSNGTWDSLKQCLLFPPTQDKFNILLDLKTLTQTAQFEDHAITSPYFTNYNVGVNDGVYFTTNTGAGYIKTGIIPSALKLNNTAIAYVTCQGKPAGNNNHNFGAYNSATQSFTFDIRNSANANFGDMYGTTTGRASQASADGAKGVYIYNRQSATNFKIIKNGTTVATCIGSQGALPTIEMYINCLNQSGVAQSRLNRTVSAFCVYGQSLTDSQVVHESAAWQTFIADAQRYGSYKKSIVFDGNSHTVAWWSKMFRQLQYNHAGLNDSTEYMNVGTSGIGTAAMITRAATVTDVLYNPAYSKNILVFWEGTNDILNGKTAMQAYNNIVTYCQARQAVGWKVIALLPMSRGYSSNLAKMLKTDSLVTMMRAGKATYCDKLCEYPNAHYLTPRSAYASDAAFKTGTLALVNDGTYFLDQTHLTETVGYPEWAPMIQADIDSL